MENQNNEENKKKKESPFYTVAIVGFVLSFIFLIVVHGIPYAPAGTVIDDAFLNTLKFMVVLKYLVPITGLLMVIIPVVAKRASGGDWIWLILIVLIVFGGFFMSTRGNFSAEGAIKGIIETPSVINKTVSDKNHSVRGHTYTVYFDDGTFGHVTNYYFNEVDAGDEVYVIYCDGVVIGVFKTSDYTLAE